MGTENKPLLSIKNLKTIFDLDEGSVKAVDGVSFDIFPQRVLGIVGESGCGKSVTIKSILRLIETPGRIVEGEILFQTRNQNEVNINEVDLAKLNPKGKQMRSIRGNEIALIPQEPMAAFSPVHTIGNQLIENILLHQEVKESEAFEIAIERLKEVGIPNPEESMNRYSWELSGGLRQRAMIGMALTCNPSLLIADEPTTAIDVTTQAQVLNLIRDLQQKNKMSIIFITHKLKEVLRIADRIAVLRQGKLVGEVTPSEASEPRLAAMMVGREVMLQVDKKESEPGESILEVKGLEARNDLDEICLSEVDLKVNAGEIVGVAGVQGNGQTELVEVLTGLRPLKNGILRIGGHDLSGATPREITDRGKICHVPEDRHSYGMVDNYSVADNLVLNSYYRSPFAKGMTIQRESIDTNAETLVKKFDVRTPSVQTTGASLSGGNQQKMVIARELSRPIQLMIAAQPTRGIDVGSIEFIHQQIVAKRDEGIAVLLISSELDEIMALSDRIVVMYRGSIIGEVLNKETTRQELGLLMAGVKSDSENIHHSTP